LRISTPHNPRSWSRLLSAALRLRNRRHHRSSSLSQADKQASKQADRTASLIRSSRIDATPARSAVYSIVVVVVSLSSYPAESRLGPLCTTTTRRYPPTPPPQHLRTTTTTQSSSWPLIDIYRARPRKFAVRLRRPTAHRAEYREVPPPRMTSHHPAPCILNLQPPATLTPRDTAPSGDALPTSESAKPFGWGCWVSPLEGTIQRIWKPPLSRRFLAPGAGLTIADDRWPGSLARSPGRPHIKVSRRILSSPRRRRCVPNDHSPGTQQRQRLVVVVVVEVVVVVPLSGTGARAHAHMPTRTRLSPALTRTRSSPRPTRSPCYPDAATRVSIGIDALCVCACVQLARASSKPYGITTAATLQSRELPAAALARARPRSRQRRRHRLARGAQSTEPRATTPEQAIVRLSTEHRS